jgi:pimeloyl-ACP methyl ester carboxylesterase
MDVVDIEGTPVEYRISGSGDPVVFVHARPFVRWYEPLLDEIDGWALLTYRRPVPDDPAFGIEHDAELCARLVARLGLQHPHVVGHSYGALVALELARQGVMAPRSLALLEPASSGLLAPEQAAASAAPLLARLRTDGPAVAMGSFLDVVLGDQGLNALDRAVPGAVDDATTGAEGFFARELPAVIRWSFAPGELAEDLPILNMSGSESGPRFAQGAQTIQSWFPHAEPCVLDGATHLLMAQDPVAAAKRLAQFWRAA